ncbi:MAG: hypothetical protein ABIF22_03225 [bacterium]
MSRKNSILIVFAIILLIIGGLLFFYFSSNNASKNTTNTTQTTTNPFGNTSVNKPVDTNTQTGGNNQTFDTVKNLSKLIQLYRNPTSGSIFLVNKSNQNILRFIDRAVGNVYEYMLENQTGEVQRITNTTIPKIQETVWSSSGSDLVLRYLDNDTDNISSFSAKIKNGSSSVDSLQELTGTFLSPNVKQLVINPAGNKMFGLVDKSDKSGTYGFTTNLDGSNKKIIFDSPISYWNISWPKENAIALTTKPSYRDVGLLYFFNTQTYSMDRILGDITGISTVVNKEASLVAYSYSMDNSFSLDVYDTINKISKNLKIKTLADKCVWGNNNTKILYCAIPQTIIGGDYPDVWYKGLQSFSDNIWKIDTDTGNMTELYKIGSDENANIDAIDLKISLDDQYLAFSNKTDLSLWLLQLGE